MKVQTGMIIALTLILVFLANSVITASAVPCNCGDICVNTSGWWQAGSAFNASNTPIQHAVDNATKGETVCVKDGMYTENVDVNKRLTIRSENGSASTTVHAANSSEPNFEVIADYVEISGFTVTRPDPARWHETAGIGLSNVEHCNISGNNASNNRVYGIWLNSSSNNTLTNNTANSNNDYGIYLHFSSNNTLNNNTMSGNTCNFCVYSCSLSGYTQNIDTSNTVDGKPVYYWINQQDKQIPDDAGYVGVVNSTNITVKDLTLSHNREGMLFVYTSNSKIENVSASNNEYGIYLYSSSNNTLMNNNVSNNWMYGILLNSSSNNNTLTNNDATNNGEAGGIGLEYSDYNTITNNIASTYCSAGSISLYYSCNNALINNNVSNCDNGDGIRLYYSSNNTLMGNTALNNCCGISLASSSGNSITCNWVYNNEWQGFHLWGGSTENEIEHNNIIRNGHYIAGTKGYEWQFYNQQNYAVTAKNNYWGHGMNNSTIDASIYDNDEGGGKVEFYPFETNHVPCAPIPELPTLVLFSSGLLVLVGYVVLKRKNR